MSNDRFDVLFVGGGLASGLAAFRVGCALPHLRIGIVEQGSTLGGDHTWSFHSTDVSEQDLIWMRPLFTQSWPGYQVRFPSYSRRIAIGYHSIRSETFHRVLSDQHGTSILLNQEVVTLTPNQVTLARGTPLFAQQVIDSRGWLPERTPTAYQKFVGLFLTLRKPHGLTEPILMDATIPQQDGFRFFYVLPWSRTRLLVEDTYYSNSAELNVSRITDSVHRYASDVFGEIEEIESTEVGALPIPLGPVHKTLGAIGVRGGFFHPTTGYSLPYAVANANRICDALKSDLDWALQIGEAGRDGARTQKFFILLNRMMFLAAEPESRYRILERFYKLPESTISRFYRGQLTRMDKLRILTGRPPVPVHRALLALKGPFGRTHERHTIASSGT